jgi:hypothetical protein
VLWKEYGAQKRSIPKDLVNFRWELKGLLESSGDRSYEFTNLGKIPVGALPLALFNQVQEPLLLSELMKLEGSVEIAEAAGLSCLEERRADLQIYRAQLRRILINSLYFLEVKADGNISTKLALLPDRLRNESPKCSGMSKRITRMLPFACWDCGNTGGMLSCTSNTDINPLITALVS